MSQDKSPRGDMKTPGDLPASAANAANWQAAFAQLKERVADDGSLHAWIV
jgi:hypothetical protein